MSTFNYATFKNMLDTLPYRISTNAKETLANNVNYARINALAFSLHNPFIIINLADNQIQMGDQLTPKVISNYEGHALLTSTSAFCNKRIDILLTNKSTQI